ncbi:MAG TPA: universal stress protein, partial [Acidimicrobiales bacterium]
AAIRATVEHDWCRPLRRRHVPFTVDTPEAAAVEAIATRAAELGAGLIVVGTRGAGLAADRTIGSTTLQLLERLSHTTTAAVAVPQPGDGAEPGTDERTFRRILVAVDGSDDAHAAFTWAADLALLTGATCHVVAVAEESDVFPLSPAASVTAEGEEHAVDRLEALTARWCARLRTSGVAHTVTVERGRPAQAIVDHADRLDADLVVVGTSGTGSAGDPMLGSVSRHVAHDAGRAVAVVPAGAHLHR